MTEKIMTLEERLGEVVEYLGEQFANERHRNRVDTKEAILEVREAVLAMKSERAKMIEEITRAVLERLDAAASKRH